jgi:aryl-alcohol dehydrogenase-like predicted oxidoreductase
LPSDRQVQELLATALEAGVNLIDTAPAYGESEARLGRFIAAQRLRWVVCTKCGETYENGRSIYDFSAAALSRSIANSLKRLRTDHIDVLLLHSDGRDLDILTRSDALETLVRAKSRGQARAIGISAKTAEGVAAAIPLLDVVMAPFSEDNRSLEAPLAAAHDNSRGILAIKGLSSGRLAAAPAIEFVLRQPFVDSLIIGTIDKEHLETAITVASAVCAEST